MKVTNKDLNTILENAIKCYINISTPCFVSGAHVETRTTPNIAVIESTLNFLISKGLISSEVRIDFKQNIAEPAEE